MRGPPSIRSCVKLYTCEYGTTGGAAPAPVAPPCGRAAKALDDAGFTCEVRKMDGARIFLWKQLQAKGQLGS